MADYRAPLRDIRFVLDHLVDPAELAAIDRFAEVDVDTIAGILEEHARFVQDVVAPLDRPGDVEGSHLDPDTGTVRTPAGFPEAYARYVEAGWGGVPFDPAYGGGGFPWLVGLALQELISTANLSFSMAPLLTQGAIELLATHGSEEQRQRYLPKMITGEWTGTMNLTEPQAGSDLGAVRTRAVRQDDGSYLVTGTKIFITYGDHDLTDNTVHLVLARTPDAPPGTKGISCFIVPKHLVGPDGEVGEPNDVTCVSVEHKMGIRASPTCVMAYGEGGGAVAELVGEEQRGMRQMFTMMNNARLSVGLQGLAVAERAYQDAVAYALERQQGRAPGAPAGTSSPIVEHPDVRRMLLTMRSLIDAMRAMCYLCARGVDLAAHHPDEAVRAREQAQLDLLIPVVKGFCTDMGVEVASLGIQVHGGIGFIEESGVPQRYRDARITPIYEGTNGIQAMDLVGRKLPMEGGAAVGRFLDGVRALDAPLAEAGDELAGVRANLATAVDAVAEATAWLAEHGAADPRAALAGATSYLRMFGLLTGGWLLARQGLAAVQGRASAPADGPDAELLATKLASARFYAEQVLPAVHGLVGPATAGADVLYSVSADGLAG
jgi:alkylation response protein AidB-like acyl-CoA dehydrogenase